MQEFKLLSEIDQQEIISKSGKIVISFVQGEAKINIYSVNSLFVKVISKEDSYTIEPFNLTDGLELYKTNLVN